MSPQTRPQTRPQTPPPHQAPAPAFPRSSQNGPNLATLDQLRSVRRRRALPTHVLRRPLPGEKVAC